ncbi:MAG: glycine cleavage system protein GcvH [Planctomycetaceae bacterium]|nr:glycine cleavage system protein GcvH [Planctomycetaceae bacterium]
MDPANLKYTKTHEWVALDGDIATVGITEFAAGQLTDLSYIELPDVGRKLSAGEDCGVVETVKAASDLYAPVAGEVTEVNSTLEEDYDLLTNEPVGDGWIMKLKVDDAADVESLLDLQAYQAHCETEDH